MLIFDLKGNQYGLLLPLSIILILGKVTTCKAFIITDVVHVYMFIITSTL
jgi:hypothetical protein